MKHEFPFGTFRPEKTGLLFQMFRCSRKVRAETTQKVVFHVLSNSIFQKLFYIMVNNLTVLYNPVTSSRPDRVLALIQQEVLRKLASGF